MFIKDGKEFEVLKIEDINPRGEEILMVVERVTFEIMMSDGHVYMVNYTQRPSTWGLFEDKGQTLYLEESPREANVLAGGYWAAWAGEQLLNPQQMTSVRIVDKQMVTKKLFVSVAKKKYFFNLFTDKNIEFQVIK